MSELPRIPLHSIEAEMSLLGSILLAPQSLEDVRSIVSSKDFFRPAHQLIFNAFESLSRMRRELDIVTLRTELTERSLLDEVGGVNYLMQLAEYVPSAANALYYAQIVKDKTTMRRLEQAGRDIIDIVHDPELEGVIDRVTKAQDQVASVADASTVPGQSVIDIKAVLLKVRDVVDENMEADGLDHFNSRFMPSKFPGLNTAIGGGYENGTICTVGARPSMGKTSYAIDEALNFALQGIPVLFVSREMSDFKIVLRFISKIAKIPARVLARKQLTERQYGDYANASETLYGLPIRFLTDSSATVGDIKREARAFARDLGSRFPVVFDDYIQISCDGAENKHVIISGMMKEYRQLVKDLDTFVMIMSQVSRNVDSRNDKRPLLIDLKESGSVEEQSDICMFLYREEYYASRAAGRPEPLQSTAEFIIAKDREGGINNVKLDFKTAFAEFVAA